MPLPASGPLSLTNIQTEFGGTNPIGMNEYYAGGGLVPAGTTGTFGAVPSSGALSVQNFYGTSQFVPVYIEDVFSTWIYTGTGATQTITNGINLSGNGGLVWTKRRSGAYDHYLYDTVRGVNVSLTTNDANPNDTGSDELTSFNSNGFTLGASANVNQNTRTQVAWTFREQPKFFDIVTYTGNGVAGRTVAHNLGSVPGCIIVKRTDTSGSWYVYHRSLGATQWAQLNSLSIQSDITAWNNTNPTSSVFSLGTDPQVNGSGGTYVAYIYAHNAGGFGLSGTDNVISCGSFTSDGSATTVSLGYEPQWLLIKDTAANLGFQLFDTMRGLRAPTGRASALYTDTAQAENEFVNGFSINATGFTVAQFASTYIYIAIRRGPMKVPTSGATVYNGVLVNSSSSTQTVNAGFPVDLAIKDYRNLVNGAMWFDRLRGITGPAGSIPNRRLLSATQGAEANSSDINGTTQTGVTELGIGTGYTSVDWFFQRARNAFDIVCYTGNSSTQNITHNLGVAPEMMIVKSRTAPSTNWYVYHIAVGPLEYYALNSFNLSGGPSTRFWNGTNPTASVFSVGNESDINSSGETQVAYLFATLSNVSKVGSYTGTGALVTVNCGFTSGARFVLIKRVGVGVSGDWWVYDSARGISAGNDPYLYMNNDAAEVTGTNYVDTVSTGFIVTAAAPAGLNASGGTYIFLAFA
jgi:hypothetical protein